MINNKTMFSFNIPIKNKMIFQRLCRQKCIGMTSFLNSCIEDFIETESRKTIKYHQDEDFVTDLYTNDEDNW